MASTKCACYSCAMHKQTISRNTRVKILSCVNPHAARSIGKMGVVLGQSASLTPQPEDAYMVSVPGIGTFAPFKASDLQIIPRK